LLCHYEKKHGLHLAMGPLRGGGGEEEKLRAPCARRQGRQIIALHTWV